MKINYVTGNKKKIDYANQKLNKFGIEVVQIKLDIDEIQSHDKLGVVSDKAKKAFAILNEPLLVTDTFWEIPALNGFPGAFMKYVNEWFVAQDFLNLMKDKADRRILCHDSIVYIDESGIKTFDDILEGEIAEKIYDDGEGLNSVDNTVRFEGKYLKEHHKEKWASMKVNKNWNEFVKFLETKV